MLSLGSECRGGVPIRRSPSLSLFSVSNLPLLSLSLFPSGFNGGSQSTLHTVRFSPEIPFAKRFPDSVLTFALSLSPCHLQENGCTVPNPLPNQTGTNTDSTNCYADPNNGNLGCGVQLKADPSPSQLNQNGGGAYVMERDLSGAGIKVWTFSNDQKAQYLSGSSVDTSTFPEASAFFGNPCPQFFGAHNIIFDITLCGDAVKDGG